ncbi:MAG: hypothetical protein M1839_004755 [Geoglossum umbratile]|nr:MAG: hypothetical protein M1839_004755 [Geoglossum umbratile]
MLLAPVEIPLPGELIQRNSENERNRFLKYTAASFCSESALTSLLKIKVDINAFDVHEQTPLIEAAEFNHPRLVTLLLDAGAEVNIHGWNEATALHHVAKHGNIYIAEQLLRKGTEVDSISAGGWGPITPLHIAAQEGFREVLELLMSEGADIERVGPGGDTALLMTCYFGHSACLGSLLKAGVRIDSRDDRKQTAFHLAASRGHLAILKGLFENRPDPELINSGDDGGNTPLHCAIWNGNEAESRFLLQNGVLVDKKNGRGFSALVTVGGSRDAQS